MFSYEQQLKRTLLELRLDIQNVTNRTYFVNEDFDPDVGITQDRRGQILPVLSMSFAFDWEKK